MGTANEAAITMEIMIMITQDKHHASECDLSIRPIVQCDSGEGRHSESLRDSREAFDVT